MTDKRRRLTNESLRAALKLWLDPSTREQAVAKYGAIGDWDVSRVTDMEGLLRGQREFNEDLSRWDTSKVERMNSTFKAASSFNQPLETWDTSKVVDMGAMFAFASSFNQPLEAWDTCKVTCFVAPPPST